MGIKQVVLFDGYGSQMLPTIIRERVEGQPFLKVRSEILVDFIKREKKHILNAITRDKVEQLKTGEYMRVEDRLYFMGSIYLSHFTMYDVDTSKRWCIEEYDGAEYVEYLDYELVDKELNCYRKK